VRRKRVCAPQGEHWERKQYHKSASRPEIREDFRLAQTLSLASKKPQGFFDAFKTDGPK
jgi:hypothetical protein